MNGGIPTRKEVKYRFSALSQLPLRQPRRILSLGCAAALAAAPALADQIIINDLGTFSVPDQYYAAIDIPGLPPLTVTVARALPQAYDAALSETTVNGAIAGIAMGTTCLTGDNGSSSNPNNRAFQ